MVKCHLVRSEAPTTWQLAGRFGWWTQDSGPAVAVGGSGLGVVSGWVCGIISVCLWGGGPPVLFHTRSVWTVSGRSNQQWRIFGGLCFLFLCWRFVLTHSSHSGLWQQVKWEFRCLSVSPPEEQVPHVSLHHLGSYKKQELSLVLSSFDLFRSLDDYIDLCALKRSFNISNL